VLQKSRGPFVPAGEQSIEPGPKVLVAPRSAKLEKLPTRLIHASVFDY
jgi:hypothetical protein